MISTMAVQTEPLEDETAFFAESLSAWSALYRGRVALVKGRELVGVYDSEKDALSVAASKFGLGPYLIRRISEPVAVPGNLAYELGLNLTS